MSKARWLSERRDDPWHKRAKVEGYPSRAAYKLLYIQKRYRVLRRGDRVVDIGSWPGGMLKVESEIVGPEGLVVAVDVREPAFKAPNVKVLVTDLLSPKVADEILNALNGERCDVLISDASPRLSGVRDVDVFNQLVLTIRALEVSDVVLSLGGNSVLKAFECEELGVLERRLQRSFRVCKRVVTPPALRKRSSEVYLVFLNKLHEGASENLRSIVM
ncbi:MAG: RlmE family RNA methyltransferase [Thaumarchaeota archaeon]|nr:RlmE family RNA methyltransferase [Candidatus Calditenuaceae archaeon]MDW8186772.1 RlmE family RNA methyltransferase [Nitrososphaerota archaeon]